VERKHEHTINEAKIFCGLYEELGKILHVASVNGELTQREIRDNIQQLFKKVPSWIQMHISNQQNIIIIYTI